MNSTAADVPSGKALYIRKAAVGGCERGASLKTPFLYLFLSERNEEIFPPDGLMWRKKEFFICRDKVHRFTRVGIRRFTEAQPGLASLAAVSPVSSG